jgi:predicted DNA-binding protein (MmcQ/YjbR family)
MTLQSDIAAVKARLDAKPGAVAEDARVRDVLIYKVSGKMFAILSMRADAAVSLKCDPGLADLLRGQYAGVGHRYHLDQRHWISVALGADVPADEILELVDQSYALVTAGLTRAQRAALNSA